MSTNTNNSNNSSARNNSQQVANAKRKKILADKKRKARQKAQRNQNVDKSPRDPKTQRSSSSKKRVSRIPALTKYLKELYEIDIRSKNDDYIIKCIKGHYDNDIAKWPALRIQLARIISALPTKIKDDTPIRSESETVKAFEETQDEPVLGIRLRALLKNKISEVFKGFDYKELLALVDDPDRVKMVTNGSSFPQMLAPPITGRDDNTAILAAMLAGRQIFESDFHIRNLFEAQADGKFITVPKNYKTGRGITIAPRILVDKQQVVSVALRDHMTLRSRNTNHIVQFDDQTVQHKLLLAGNATIDLSSASDRIYRSLVKDVWPEFYDTFEHLLPKDVYTPDGKVVPLTCVGTQGFPLTFTLMAIIIGLIVEAVKVTAFPSANYGDDIICSEKDFDEVYVALEGLGLKVNKSKTHKSSDGFLESCGRDVMFTSDGARDITPVYLRGTQDVDFIQFFYQLCKAKLIKPEDATSILGRLNVDFYAFEYEYQLTEFHFPFGDNINVPKAKWSRTASQYVCAVPSMKEEVTAIKGLSKKESALVLELLHIEAGLKNPNNSKVFRRGSDPIARPYGLMDIRDNKLYGLYSRLDNAGVQLPEIFYEELEKEYHTTFKALNFYRFITSEMNRYKYSTPTEDFSTYTAAQPTLQEFIESEFGINSEVRYPIYRYESSKSTKTIVHPNSNKILGV